MAQSEEKISPTHSSDIFKRISSAPPELKAFMIFALVVAITQFAIMFFFPFEIRRIYAEKIGVVTSSSYMFSLIFVFLPVSSGFKIKLAVVRWGIVMPMVVVVFISCLMYLNIIHDGDRFIKSGYWGLVWSVIMPIIWILVILLSPRITKFYENISTGNTLSGLPK